MSGHDENHHVQAVIELPSRSVGNAALVRKTTGYRDNSRGTPPEYPQPTRFRGRESLTERQEKNNDIDSFRNELGNDLMMICFLAGLLLYGLLR